MQTTKTIPGTDIRIFGTDDEPLFTAIDVGRTLGISNIHTTLANYGNDMKVYTSVMCSMGYPRRNVLLTKLGMVKLIQHTRKSVDPEIAIFLGLTDHRFTPAETDFITNIQRASANHKSVTQFPVDRYLIDLYFIDLLIAVEFDERHHNGKEAEDQAREKYITEKLGCEFLRVKETDNIFDAISRLYVMIAARS